MGCMGRYLDKGKAPDRDDPDGLPARGIKMGGCLVHRLDKLFAILAEHTEFDELRSIVTNISRVRKPSIMPKRVQLSQGNHGISWMTWSRLVGGVYSLSLILSCSISRPCVTCVTARSTPMCHPRSTVISSVRGKLRKVS